MAGQEWQTSMESKSSTKLPLPKIAITIVFGIIRAAMPFYRAFHSASLRRLMKGILYQEFLFLFIEEGYQRGCNDLSFL